MLLNGEELSDESYFAALLKLEEVAYGPPTPEAGVAAVAILLREHLNQSMEFSVPDDVWFMIEDIIQTASYPRRAVLRRAVRLASTVPNKGAPDAWRERAIDPHSVNEEPFNAAVSAVLRDLRAFASLLEPSSIRVISMADYGSGADQHTAALTALVEAGKFVLTPEMTEAPSEVIELTAHDPTKSEFFVCAAILMITELSGSIMDYMEFRWGRNGHVFVGNISPMGETLLRGFRLLLEGRFAFDDMNFHEQGHAKRCEMIPYFDTWRV